MRRKLLILSISLLSFTITGCAVRLIPGSSYCYICCACIGSGSLEILDDKHFRMEYTEYISKKQDRITVGTGTYTQQKGTLTLTFEDMPKVASEIRIHKIADAQKLEIRVIKVIDHLSPDSLGGAALAVKIRNNNRAYIEQHMDGDDHPRNVLVWNPSVNKSADWILEASFMGRNNVSVPLPPPGIYEAIIVMPSDYADVHLGSGEVRIFKVTGYPGQTEIRQKGNSKIFFTTESCYCN